MLDQNGGFLPFRVMGRSSFCLGNDGPNLLDVLGLRRARFVRRGTEAGRMGKSALKAVAIFLTRRPHWRLHASRTLLIAIVMTLVTLGLLALYLMQEKPGLH